MSSFRDTFTKEEKQDNLLDYDDSAFVFFAAAVLLCILVPWTWKVVTNSFWPSQNVAVDSNSRNVSEKTMQSCKCASCAKTAQLNKSEHLRWSRRCRPSVLAQVAILALLWYAFGDLSKQCANTKQIQNFDPFEILNVTPGATDKEIKKAYRIMSLKFHPDKNPNDPTAGAKFVMISKAHQALTDEIAKRNFEKYGNPDGQGFMKVGIGLPKVLVAEENQLFFLLFFFIILLVVLPLIFIAYYRHTKRYGQNGVQVETLQFLSYFMNQGTRVKNLPEFLASSGESRELSSRPTDNQDMKKLVSEVVEPRKRQSNIPLIVRNYFLILGHMQRLHHLMSPELKADLDQLLRAAPRIIQSMMEIALYGGWHMTAESVMDFSRSIIHCLGTRDSSLLQIPHFDADILKSYSRQRGAAKDLKEFIVMDPTVRAAQLKLSDEQKLDVEAFCRYVPHITIETEVLVDDENEMVVGDVATVNIKMTRQNLEDGHTAGFVHAPNFPAPKSEHWWILVKVKEGGLVGFAVIRNFDRVVEENIKFPLRNSGKMSFVVQCLCDAYAGLDQEAELSCTVYKQTEVKREVFVHPDDVALDNQPTVIQQMLGQMGGGEESSDDENGDDENGDDEKPEQATGDEDSESDSAE